MIIPEFAELQNGNAQTEDQLLNKFIWPASGFELTPRKENRELVSPESQKRQIGFSPYSPRLRQRQLERQPQIILSQSPLNRPFQLPVYGGDCTFDDAQIPAMYETDMGVFGPFKLPANRPGSVTSSPFKTARKLSYQSCDDQQQPHNSPALKPVRGLPNAHQQSLIEKMNRIRTPETMLSSAVPLPEPRVRKNQRLKATKPKKRSRIADMEQQSNSEQDADNNTLGRAKGLRNLSSSVRDIVLQLKRTTYKEVAGRLIDRLVECGAIGSNTKDEQNVKRRVYDALNVLIAAEVLRKEGKMVMALQNETGQRKLPKDSIAEKQALQQEIQARQASIKEKLEQARIIESRRDAVRMLIERNKQEHSTHDPVQSIPFPFVTVPTSLNNIMPSSTITKHQIVLNFRSSVQTVVDSDALLVLYWDGCINQQQPNSPAAD